ncbi:hypothetical protein CLOSTASPAR_03396 [[Clostridium] asparagiforme DSM 15981]|uniref:Uncharacterized protein n=1 Tax=[Clostridium] asparagiforme DSM 15981 TaxID=518636 RepID=C0D2A7_9FIRM|nr:hypothetical protein CLOSTASPAR_03396 [[Clostridium] asparagiforme DSM 15981]
MSGRLDGSSPGGPNIFPGPAGLCCPFSSYSPGIFLVFLSFSQSSNFLWTNARDCRIIPYMIVSFN